MPCKLMSPELPLGLSRVINEEFHLDCPEVEEAGSKLSPKEWGCTNPVQPRLTPPGNLVAPWGQSCVFFSLGAPDPSMEGGALTPGSG